jgi:hypothetical protein
MGLYVLTFQTEDFREETECSTIPTSKCILGLHLGYSEIDSASLPIRADPELL